MRSSSLYSVCPERFRLLYIDIMVTWNEKDRSSGIDLDKPIQKFVIKMYYILLPFPYQQYPQ